MTTDAHRRIAQEFIRNNGRIVHSDDLIPLIAEAEARGRAEQAERVRVLEEALTYIKWSHTPPPSDRDEIASALAHIRAMSNRAAAALGAER